MKKTFTILMALMVLCFTQCKPTPEGGDDNAPKVRVSCVIPMNDGSKSDFTNLMTNGKINWSNGRECVYLAIHGNNPQIIELVSYADGYPSKLEFSGEAAEGLITSGEEYDIWYFGHSQQLDAPYYNLANDRRQLTGSIANQSGNLSDLGYCHIAKTKVTAVTENGEVKLNLKGTLANQIAIALLDLNNVTELYGDAIIGTEYALECTGGRYELNVVENNNAKINVEGKSGISYVIILPNENNETNIKIKRGGNTYAYTFHNSIKANKVYYRTALDGTPEALPWSEIEEEPEAPNANSREYVDLGLSVNWATCNVGAEFPEEYGDYYAWGETTTKDTYDYDNSATYKLSHSELQSQGYIDENDNLTLPHDAARANWGGDWRMPTQTELDELMNECVWTQAEQNGAKGCKVTGPNGNSIFLPFAGEIDGGSVVLYEGSFGTYWSSTYSNDNPYYDQIVDEFDYYIGSYGFTCQNYGFIYNDISEYSSYYGLTIRPVIRK